MKQPAALFTFTLVFALALALYVSTTAPSLTWAHNGADGGDLITAAVTNGVPHPPGYPTYVTLGQLVARIPLGTVAYRFNLFSAFCMALAAGFTALSIWRLAFFFKEMVAITASLFFVTAPMVWGQATITEVHALNAGLVACIVYLISPTVFQGKPVSLRRFMLAAGLWGVAFGNSLTVAALTPLFIIAGWRVRHVSPTPFPSIWPIIAFLAGVSVYAAIPLRAAQQPPVNWGNPTSLERFLALITAQLYQGYALSTPPAEIWSRLIAFAQLIVTQYGWLGVILGAAGVYAALISANTNWRWLAVTLVLYLLFAVTYSAADSALYLLPIWMLGAWAIARGLLRLAEYTARFPRPAPSAVLILVLLLGPLASVFVHFPAMNLRGDHTAADFAQAALIAAPPRAILITENDGQTFTLWYYRHVAEQRPDLAVVDRRLAGYPWYDAMLRAQGSVPVLPGLDPAETWLDRVAQLNPGRPVCIIDRISAQMSCQA